MIVRDTASADSERMIGDLRRQLIERTTERDEALAREVATAEVLRHVIGASRGDLAPVFDAMLEKGLALCDASLGTLWTYDGEYMHPVASRGVSPEYAAYVSSEPLRPGAGALGTFVRGEALLHVVDLKKTDAYIRGDSHRRALVDLGGGRCLLGVPLRTDDDLLGAFLIYRREPQPFTEKQIALLQHFAAQAVIAIENARLLVELRSRTNDLQEALEYQTATSEVLQSISRSTFDLDSVLRTVVTTAGRLCRANYSVIFRNVGGEYRFAAGDGNVPEYVEYERRAVIRPGRGTLIGRAVLEGRAVQIADAWTDPDYAEKESARINGAHSMLGVPLLRDDQVIGALGLARDHVEAFSEREMELVTTFADQAAIAIENARLLNETHEALEQQTATAQVLQVINSSPGDLAPVFDAVLERAMRLCQAQVGLLTLREDDRYKVRAARSRWTEFVEFQGSQSYAVDRSTITGRVVLEHRTVQIADVAEDPDYDQPESTILGRVRSVLGVPLLREGDVVGTLNLARERVEPFSESQISLMENFAAQAVVAMENARLLTETRAAKDDAEAAYRDLQAAQDSLVQAQKMAALGQLTAGIAHEIKNPLNFVNNFASLSTELLGELKQDTEPALAALESDEREQIDETIELLTGNLEKIVEHGQRADNIVKSMLEHSRGVSGERREVDLNAVIEEALNLAYHGARARDQSFNITLERDYVEGLKPIELAPQEITRVFLNLFSNGFYAANKRARDNGDGSFRPVLSVRTREDGDVIEVRVRDNGTGIPPEVRDKLFQPFFTTKPTGEGTGLGLSISYDIVTQQHGGTITVESEPGSYTEFTVRLPRQ